MSPLFSVPQDELQPEYIPLPTAHYDVDFEGAETDGNEADWRCIKATFTNFATVDGGAQVTTTHKGKDVTLTISGRTKTVRYTTASSNAQAVAIGARDIVRLAQALGVAHTNGDGRVTVEGETPEEVVEALNAARGKRVRISIKQQARKRKKEVVLDAKGEPIIDDEVKAVWDPSAA